jgi:peptidoglycan-associated lipoprotein
MRFCLSRFALALGLFALAPVCAAQSYVVLLKNPVGMENHVHIINSKGVFGITHPGYGAPIGKQIQTVRRYEPEQINADFADALGSMSSILAAGLPVLPHSYVALLELPQGPVGNLSFNSEDGLILLDKAGQAVLIDGYSDEVYQADLLQVRQDFAPALASLDAIIKAGFRPSSYIVLLESPDGSVGKVSVTDARGKTLIEEAGQAVDMDIYPVVDEQLFKVKKEVVKEDFGNAIDSTPPLPVKYVLLFKSGSTKLAVESEEEARKLLEDVKSRPAPDVTINGHTDTVGGVTVNDKLSEKRAESVAQMILSGGVEPRAMEIEYYGKRDPYIKTPDNTPELRNRRVEVTVR